MLPLISHRRADAGGDRVAAPDAEGTAQEGRGERRSRADEVRPETVRRSRIALERLIRALEVNRLSRGVHKSVKPARLLDQPRGARQLFAVPLGRQRDVEPRRPLPF